MTRRTILLGGTSLIPGQPPVPGASLAALFRPKFLELVASNRHRSFLRDRGLLRIARGFSTIGDLLDVAYETMFRSYRCEYVYKNEILRRIFLSRHDPTNATVLSEYHVAWWENRVDLVVVNSTTTAYEIKTEFDSIDRLQKQLAMNLALFDRTVVVAAERHAERLRLMTDRRVGIMAMTRRGALATIRKPLPNADNVNPALIFRCLRAQDYVAAVSRDFGTPPALSAVALEDWCYRRFRRLSSRRAHAILLSVLRSRFLSPADRLVEGLPAGLAHLYYRTKPRQRATLFDPGVLGRSIRK